MRITGFESNDQLLAELGQRIRDVRVAMPFTRDELAGKSGVSARTIANLELGHGATFDNVINVLRALNLTANLESLVPEQGPRPSDLAKLGGKRQRATSPKNRRGQAGQARTGQPSPSAWTWGDDASESWQEASAFTWKEDE